MSKASRDKGAAFEREVANAFRMAWNVEVERTPLSGGWGRKKTMGDLVFMNPVIDIFVECKNPKGINFETVFVPGNPTHPIWAWWENAKMQAKQEDKRPVLIFKWWRSQTWVLMKSDTGPLRAVDPGNEVVSFTLFPMWLEQTRGHIDGLLHKV